MAIDVKEYVPRFVITVGGVVLEHGFTADVIALTITECSDQADDFSFTVRDRHPDKARFPSDSLKWMDSGKLEQGKEVEIEFGYRNGTMRKFVGVITSVAPTFPESGVPTIAVGGRSLYEKLNVQCDAKAFSAKKYSDIAREIAGKINLSYKGEDTTAEYPLISSESGTYSDILKKLADMIGFEAVVKERNLIFERPRYLTDKSPVLTLEWGRSLKSFTPVLSTYKKYTHVSVRSSQTSYERGKEALVGSAGPGQERAKMGKESASQIAMRISGKNELRSDLHDIVSQEEANNAALALLEKSSIGFITGSGACNGNPLLKARSIIELKGLGQRFSGMYYVTSANHYFDASGYRTDFQVNRNGI